MTPNQIAKLFEFDETQTTCLKKLVEQYAEQYAKEQVNEAMMIHRVAEAVKCGMCND